MSISLVTTGPAFPIDGLSPHLILQRETLNVIAINMIG